MTGLLKSIKDPKGPKIIVCCGSGGVGKTTISAAVGLYGAMAGKKTIVLTIDPAKRLADSLGLKRFETNVQRVPVESLNLSPRSRLPAAGLYAMMLDPKTTFDQLVARYAPPEFQKNIFQNRYYQHLSNNMAGSHEYMAMETLYEIFNQDQYDLIVLDTPPSRRALDFLEAPQRMMNILGHSTFMKLFKPYLKVGKWGFRFLNLLASPILKAVSKVIGTQALEDFAGFMALWDDILFEGFSRRAAAVKELLAGSQTLFLAVATPQRLPVDEAIFLYRTLSQNRMPFGGVIVNRVSVAAPQKTDRELEINSLFADSDITPDLKKKLIRIHEKMQKMAESDARSIHRLMDTIGAENEVIQIPYADGEIANLDDLLRLTRFF